MFKLFFLNSLGRSKGGFSTKIHLRCEGNGLPLTFIITVGERHEAVVFEPLMAQGSVKRVGIGRPRLRPGPGQTHLNSECLMQQGFQESIIINIKCLKPLPSLPFKNKMRLPCVPDELWEIKATAAAKFVFICGDGAFV
jgi:hypothetical protein